VIGDVSSVARRIGFIRRQRKLSLDALAKRTRLTKSYLSKIERGLSVPSIASIMKLSRAFGVEVAHLFGETIEENNICIERHRPARANGRPRLNVIPIRVPELRERREDVPLLANHFLKKYAPGAGKSIHGLEAASLEALTGYDWPGNVRQLENTIERAVALETSNEPRVELPAERPKARAVAAGAETAMPTSMTVAAGSVLPQGVNMENYVAQIERSLLQSALGQTNGVQVRAADVLGISYRSFRHLMKKYEL